jgi:integrase
MGRIYKRGKMWYLDYADTRGARLRYPYSSSKEAATDELKRCERLVALHTSDRAPLGLVRWEDFKGLLPAELYPKRKKPTVAHYKRFVGWVDEYIKPDRLRDITPKKVEKMRMDLKAASVPDNTLARGIRGGFAVFTWAHVNGYIYKIEWHAVEIKTPKKKKKTRILSVGEFRLYLFALMTHRLLMRPSEAYFARWDRVLWDLQGYDIRDDISCAFDVKADSDRVMYIPDRLFAVLKEQRKNAKTEYILENEYGYRIHHQSFFKKISKGLTHLGYKEATSYSFRHTGATQMTAARGVAVTNKAMAHKSLETTMIYVHPVSPEMRAAVQNLEDSEYHETPLNATDSGPQSAS